MQDETEDLRRARVQELNSRVNTRESLEAKHGQVWDTDQLREEFDVTGFMAPLVVVTRKSDSQQGSLEFTHSPRFYFSFTPYNK